MIFNTSLEWTGKNFAYNAIRLQRESTDIRYL